MTEEESSGETKKGHKDSSVGKGRANGNNDENSSVEVDKKDKGDEKPAIEEENLDPEERERRDKEERIAASLKKREAEVAKEVCRTTRTLDLKMINTELIWFLSVVGALACAGQRTGTA